MKHLITFVSIFVFIALVFHSDFSSENLNRGMAQITGPYLTEEGENNEEMGPIEKTEVTGEIDTIVSNNETVVSNKIVEKQKQNPVFLIDTFITSGPANGEIISQTNRVVFEFKGTIVPENKGAMSFETKVEGLDKNWQSISSGKRTIDFPAGNHEYVFLVRAKVNNSYDQTPAIVKFTIKTSPYFQKVKISSLSKDSISLNTYLQDEEKINITGWKIKSGKGGELTIPQGAEVYSGISTANSDILIKKYDSIYIQSKSIPFGSNNRVFRPNKCFGYLAESYGSTFPLSYGKVCPKINRDEICYFSKKCQDSILQLQSCRRFDFSKNPQITYDSSCIEYIRNYISQYLNYEGCLNYYLKDENFLEKKWYIFAGYSIMCRCGKDTIYLYDKDGLLVDKRDYEQY